ncbi:hypothetical protein PoB_002160400 [Plakobranchus ocellatus]|uniref:Uncharacterized protein n=1 Tax=Plakobranchus ocellatus TaxID=259542 RepID=A0AAV3ZIE7_9GAST|nr:hypothetical protein PoB_002160400 [Plakobranchus ocellatus]
MISGSQAPRQERAPVRGSNLRADSQATVLPTSPAFKRDDGGANANELTVLRSSAIFGTRLERQAHLGKKRLGSLKIGLAI